MHETPFELFRPIFEDIILLTWASEESDRETSHDLNLRVDDTTRARCFYLKNISDNPMNRVYILS